MTEKTVFIPDDQPNMSIKDKNMLLSGKLAGTHVNKQIVKIERLEIAVQGWRITYRTAD